VWCVCVRVCVPAAVTAVVAAALLGALSQDGLGPRRPRSCLDAVLDLVSIASLVPRRPVLAEGCYNLLFATVNDGRLSSHVLDFAQVPVGRLLLFVTSWGIGGWEV
jgi:hypothetical protein